MTAITRPNGKVWRGRLPVRWAEYETHDGETGFVILGTHDVQAAFDLLSGYADDYGLAVEQAARRWWRLVPWSSGSFDSTWIDDPVRGTPCVVFNP